MTTTRLNNEQVLVTIEVDPDDIYRLIVRPNFTYYDGRYGEMVEVVNTSPDPTWASPAEINDMLADAVRRLLDRMWKVDTGVEIER